MGPMMMTAVPPVPPEIAAQQQQVSAAPMFAQMGAQNVGIPDPIGVLEQQMAKLEEWAGQTAPLLGQVNPALSTLLVPIAQAGKALQAEIQSLKERSQGPSPQVAGTVAPTVPGNIPGAAPAY